MQKMRWNHTFPLKPWNSTTTSTTKPNGLIEGTEFEGKSLEDIIKTSSGGVFNNSAQVYNHTFYWNCLSPNGGGEPTGAVAEAINAAFGSFEKRIKALTNIMGDRSNVAQQFKL